MTAVPGWPASSGLATFQDIRRALAGQVARSATGELRTGIFPTDYTVPLVVGTNSMNVIVRAFVAVLDRNGAVFVPNDGDVNVLLSSAPSSGSRWSVVFVKQQETVAPFSDSVDGPIIDKVESTVSEAAARALLPTGAYELVAVKVDAGSSTTNAVGVTITPKFRYTAMAGGTIPLLDQADANAWTPVQGTPGFRIDQGIEVIYDGGWRTNKPGLIPIRTEFFTGASVVQFQSRFNAKYDHYKLQGFVTFSAGAQLGFQMMNGSSPAAGASDYYAVSRSNSGASITGAAVAGNSGPVHKTNVASVAFDMELYNPLNLARTIALINSHGVGNSSAAENGSVSVQHNLANAYTGIQFVTGSGITLSGSISLFGYFY